MDTIDLILRNAALTLLFLAMLAARRLLARGLIAGAAAALFLQAALIRSDLVTVVWTGAILCIFAVILARDLLDQGTARFSEEEAALRRRIFALLPARSARQFLDLGWWLNAGAGETLTQQGKPVEHVVFLAEGTAEVIVGGTVIGECNAGDLIGEATVLSGDAATATVRLTAPSRIWCAKASAVRAFTTANPDLVPPLERSFSAALREKLVATNQRLVSASTGTAGG